jgi:hypothetical protein
MKISEIYDLAIEMGINADPRGKARIKSLLKKEKEIFEKLSKSEKNEFDKERFSNPYPDSRFLCGEMSKNVKRILAGIDINGSEILLADRLGEKGKNIDLVLAHHPWGLALTGIDKQVAMQSETLTNVGVSVNIAEAHIDERVDELTRSLNPVNHYQVVDIAKLLDISFMNAHTIVDNLLHEFISQYFEKNKPDTLEDIITLAKKIPEFHQASIGGYGPIISLGKSSRKCGKITFVELTGGTNGSKKVYEGMSRAGINTIVGMHMPADYRLEIEKLNLNLVILGHIPSDSLGMNLLLDELEKKGIEVIPCGGLIRVKRFKK